MGRPKLDVGTYGKIDYLEVKPKHIRARARYRDVDGVTRTITRFGSSRSAATAALKRAIRDRVHVDRSLDGDATLRTAAAEWLATVDGSDLASGTKDHYRYVLDRYVLASAGDLKLREATVPRLDRLVKAVAQSNGPGAAKSARSVLSGLLGHAVRQGAIPSNPVRDLARVRQPQRTQPRSLTVEETRVLLEAFAADPWAVEHDLPDLARFMLQTGVRIGEACAVRESSLQAAGVVEIDATVVRIRGVGQVIQERPKTAAGWRVLALPSSLVTLLAARPRGEHDVLFASPFGRLRDVSNTTGDLRKALDRAGFDWATSHTFRKTVATRLDEAGRTARQIADQLGHARPSLTQDVYMGRRVVDVGAATALELAS